MDKDRIKSFSNIFYHHVHDDSERKTNLLPRAFTEMMSVQTKSFPLFLLSINSKSISHSIEITISHSKITFNNVNEDFFFIYANLKDLIGFFE